MQITNARAVTIGQLSEATAVNVETIRYYERIKLMPTPRRTQGGHRTYEDIHLRRLRFIRRARELGFGIEDIRALLTLAEPKNISCADVQKISIIHLENVRAKLSDLTNLERILSQAILKCAGKTATACPVIEALNGED